MALNVHHTAKLDASAISASIRAERGYRSIVGLDEWQALGRTPISRSLAHIGLAFPIYLLGRELQELVPVAFLPEDFALTIAAMSYNGKLDFSLLGDYDAMPDIELVGQYVEEALEELLVAAGRPPSNRGRT